MILGDLFKKIIKKILSLRGYEIKPKAKKPPSPIHLWDNDRDFNIIYDNISKFTIASKQRCYVIYQFLKQCSSVSGEIAEIGVFKGGTAYLINKVLIDTNKTIYLFDTFSGSPKADHEKDPFYYENEGMFSDTSLDSINKMFSNQKNVIITQGEFPKTSNIIQEKYFSFVHIDVDIYKSIMECCLFFYNRMNVGGILLFDDYGDLSCPGAKEAVDEFFSDKLENPIYLPTGQSFIIKVNTK